MLKLYDPQIRDIESIISDLESNDKTKIANALADFHWSSNNVGLMLKCYLKYAMHPDDIVASTAIIGIGSLARLFRKTMAPKRKKLIIFLKKLKKNRVALSGNVNDALDDIRHFSHLVRQERRKRRKRKKHRNCL